MTSEEKIKFDLENLDEITIVKKYLFNTDIWYFTCHLNLNHSEFMNNLDLMNEIISKNLSISMKNILIVGSGKTGFSFSPQKALRKFDSNEETESDIDIAIVSEKYFFEYWDLAREEISVRYSHYYKEISSGIFNGFISKNTLENIPSIRKVWNERIRATKRELKEKAKFRHPINFRIYRSWEDLEEYHVKGINKLKKAIMEEVSK
ncbi:MULTISPECIES: hypothetical protein [Bacillus]|uniref:Uncharacterized protein n=1 Tax=Bacillus pumilus TaxID=1408 RepID=A0AAE3WLD0_BACPU|nr:MULTISPECIES: hypothetical protein [Bacillus]MBW0257409.1 hypothetical protein [Bacillus sp. F2HM]MDF9460226.1 hypothetical protein [Bacillus pumilus]MDR4250961.1 hypothetical protein [Bacillus pumilus]